MKVKITIDAEKIEHELEMDYIPSKGDFLNLNGKNYHVQGRVFYVEEKENRVLLDLHHIPTT